MKANWQTRTANWLRVFTWVYFTIVLAWALTHPFLGDHPWWLFPVNALAFYLFAPLPLVVLLALLIRRRDIWLGTLVVFFLALFLYGNLFLPWRTAVAPTGGSIRVMTYNILGFNEHADAVVAALLASDADVVALQELNPEVAHAIVKNLAAEYPYQELDPQTGVFGAGVISRYPLSLSDERLPGSWIGTPQIVVVRVGSQNITLLNAHTFASHPGPAEQIEALIAAREALAGIVKDFAIAHREPLIVAMDLNASSQNTPYKIIANVLSDSWPEAGWGLGNTFPGVGTPTWFLRIDYVFHSHHFRAIDAQIGPWDGYSDHRPVIAWLVFNDE